MFKPVPLAYGCIVTELGSVANVANLDETSLYWLSAVLGTAGLNHTYLKIGVAPIVEYVRARVESGMVIIDRAQDNTVATAFPAGTQIEYILTAAAVQDMLNASGLGSDVSITVQWPLIATEIAANQYEITIVPTTIGSDGSIDVTGTYPDFSISVARGANGCGCD